MDRALISSEVVELLSQLTGQKLRQQDASPPVIFLTAVLAVLNGVIFADGAVAEQEKEKLERTLNRLCSSSQHIYSLAKIISDSFQQKKYNSLDNIITLTESFSEAEKLLLLSLGYEMSVADGEMEQSEQKYLKRIANNLEIASKYQTVIESVLAGKEEVDSSLLIEIRSLLEPSRFRELDTIFVLAAEQVFEQLPHLEAVPNEAHKPKFKGTYQELEKFLSYQKNLEALGEQLLSILKNSNEQGFLSSFLVKNLEEIYQSFRSQEFRVAVIGDFSRGKSTLLNALVGEEIQPTRAIPCSGTVSVIKYGSQKRVVCIYKDGTQEEISLDEYQDKVSLDKHQPLRSWSEGLGENKIKEVVFEHPHLELCKNGVAIIDSPGLNEHPERTAITKQILQQIDAVIFLTDTFNTLTEAERKLIEELKQLLSGGDTESPIANLFIIVNKWDLLRTEKDRQEVKERIESIVFGQKAWLVGEERIHYLSAQEALTSILEGTANDYLKEFQRFTTSLEKFLAEERGSVKSQRFFNKVDRVIDASLEELEQAKNILNEEVSSGEAERIKILEEIGEISGRDAKIKFSAAELQNKAFEEIEESFIEWLEGLRDRLVDKVEKWSSDHSAIWSRERLVTDYARQFSQDLSDELNGWIENKLHKRILSRYLDELALFTKEEVKSLENQLNKYNFPNQSKKVNWTFYNEFKNPDIVGFGSLTSTQLGAVLLVSGLLFAPLSIASLVIGLGITSIGSGAVDMWDLDGKIKGQVFYEGLEQFRNSSSALEIIKETVEKVISEKLDEIDKILSNGISVCENHLLLIEVNIGNSQARREETQAFITHKSQELQLISNQIKEQLNQLDC